MNKLKRKYIPLTVLQQVEVLLEISVLSDQYMQSFNYGGVDANEQEKETHTVDVPDAWFE